MVPFTKARIKNVYEANVTNPRSILKFPTQNEVSFTKAGIKIFRGQRTNPRGMLDRHNKLSTMFPSQNQNQRLLGSRDEHQKQKDLTSMWIIARGFACVPQHMKLGSLTIHYLNQSKTYVLLLCQMPHIHWTQISAQPKRIYFLMRQWSLTYTSPYSSCTKSV